MTKLRPWLAALLLGMIATAASHGLAVASAMTGEIVVVKEPVKDDLVAGDARVAANRGARMQANLAAGASRLWRSVGAARFKAPAATGNGHRVSNYQ